MHVDEAYRGSVGAVESSLCSLGTASLFVATLSTTTADTRSFDGVVYASAAFVGSAALVYSLWVLMFHEHEHAHPLFDPGAGGGGIPGAVHRHTTQQLRALEESGNTRTHIHLHFHPPCGPAAHHLKHSHMHTHHGHDEEGGHSHSHAHPHP